MSNPNGTQAVDRAARLLSEVVHSADPMTFTELSAVSGLAKSTTSRLLLALERNRLVRRDDHGRFLPGEMFVSFAWRGGAEAGLIAVAQPFLEKLGKATGETINLGISANGMVEQIAQVDSTYLIGGTNWVGLTVPLHCSALGKVLLAYGAVHLLPATPSAAATSAAAPSAATPAPSAAAPQLERRTDKTIVTEAGLKADLAAVRARGYAVTDEELEPGLIAIAAPVFGFDGAVVAALSVSAPTTRMTAERVSVAAEHCMEEAAALSAVLGYRQRTARQARTGRLG
jgi:IclR family transcriptional regulator, acetate operon repressor